MIKLFIILLISYQGFAQKTNLEIQDSLLKSAISSVYTATESSQDSIGIFVEKHIADWMVLQNAVKLLGEYDYIFVDSSEYNFRFYLKSIKPVYNTFIKDSIAREIKLTLSYQYSEKGKLIIAEDYILSYKDTISYFDIPEIEDISYKFTTGFPPEPQTSFWDVYIEPVIVVSAAILTVVLFFSIRSG